MTRRSLDRIAYRRDGTCRVCGRAPVASSAAAPPDITIESLVRLLLAAPEAIRDDFLAALFAACGHRYTPEAFAALVRSHLPPAHLAALWPGDTPRA